MRKQLARLILACALVAALCSGASAQALLGGDYGSLPAHDFVAFFGFKEREKGPGPAGTTQHRFTDNDRSLMLDVDTLPDGRIVHLKLAIPRQMIDESGMTLAGRDVVKSFVGASMASGADYLSFHPLMNEIAVRDLDLHPVTLPPTKFADSGKPVPKNAYKIGSGPLVKGDRITFIERIPDLAPRPSAMYLVFSGKDKGADLMGDGCRLQFVSATVDGVPSLVCDAWDKAFFQKANPSKPGDVAESDTDEAILNRALDLLRTKDPVQSRLVEIEIDRAVKGGSKDYRIDSMKTLASFQVGRQSKGLTPLRTAIKAIPENSTHDEFIKEMSGAADQLEKRLAEKKTSTVPPEKRKYEMPQGAAAVIAERDEATGVVTMGISGGHDPDGGAQDGLDDGIIQVLQSNINKPTEVFRKK